MKLTGRIFAFLMASVLVLSGLFLVLKQPVYADEPAAYVSSSQLQTNFPEESGTKSKLLSSDNQGVSFRVDVPWEQLSLEPVIADGKDYLRVLLPGWSQTITPGLPALPLIVEKFGVPFGAKVSVSVVPGKAHTLKISAPVQPVVTQLVEFSLPEGLVESPSVSESNFIYAEDPSVYADEAVYPEVLAEISADGILRQQRVVGVAAYPIQYDPKAMQLTVYESLQITISFEGSSNISSLSLITDSPSYENFFKGELLNYESARGFRQASSPNAAQQDLSGEGSGAQAAEIPWAPPEPGWRVRVQGDGFYQLTYSELSDIGFLDSNPDPRTFQLFYMGEEVAIQVPGEEDGVFGTEDTVRFFGQGMDSKYAQNSVYWLTYDLSGVVQGKRLESRDGTPGTSAMPGNYRASLHMENNAYYLSWLPFEEETERWWWDIVQRPSKPSWTLPTFTLIAPDTDPAQGPAKLSISVVGYTANTINPDHHMQVTVNNVIVGDAFFDGREWRVFEFLVDQGILQAGTNTVKVSSIPITDVNFDYFLVDWVRIDYPNTFQTENDELAFEYAEIGTWKFQVNGFSSDQVAVFDVSDPLNVVWMENVSVVSGGSSFNAQFQDAVMEPSNYWTMTDATFRTVAGIDEVDMVSNLRATTNGADHIIISHDEFWSQALTLRDHRAASMRAVVVDVQDIYDEFGYGMVGADAIRDFLGYTYANWQAPAPSYVVLLGDGHYDPKDHYGYGRTNFIPAYLLPVDPWIGETASDNRYVTLVGEDSLPDMMIGRLAVNNVAEASAFVNKIINYETTPVAGEWKQQILAVADNADYAGDFAAISDNLLETYIATPYTAEKVYYGVPPYPIDDVALARQAIVNGINAGKLIVNYIGHSGITAWGDQLFKVSQVAGLTNGGKMPIMLDMTCYDGTFHYPDPPSANYEGLGEVTTRADGKGAIANWSATGNGVASGHFFLNQGFFQSFFHDGLITVGSGTATGKFELWSIGGALDLLDTYTLFGDPALRIALEGNTNNPPVITEGASVHVTMSENGFPVAFEKTLHATDADGDSLTWSLSGAALHGTATAAGTGNSIALGYVPEADYFGTDMFIVQVSDGSLADFITVNVTIEAVNEAPVLTDIPDQTIAEGESFRSINLDDYVSDPDNLDSEMEWSYTGNTELGVSIVDRVATISIPDANWNGSETITFKATDPGGLWDEDAATFMVTPVNDAPVVTDIPDQTILEGESFTTINLDDYVSDVDNPDNEITWSYSGNIELAVSIDDRVATITAPVDWTGSETITFRATDPDGLWDEDAAIFTVIADNPPETYYIFLPLILK